MVQHKIKTTLQKDERLKPCPICGSDMLARFKNVYSSIGWVFSCSNEDCILHRSKNNIRVPMAYNPKTKKSITEEDAIKIINRRTN